jgi:Helix-turn-helix domain
MTHPRNAPPAGVSRAGADAERATFLRDLRALRDRAGLGARDLAARAHFPEDTLTTAEAGPALPSLPVLQAYVRGCGAGEAEWEDRWRRLNSDSESGGSALPTRAPSAARPATRMVPFPESTGSPSPTEQEAIGFGLARVARGLAPADSDPLLSDGTGWFDPAPRPSASPSMFTPSPGSSSAPPPPAPEVNPGAPTIQYPALSGYGTPEAAPGYGTPESAYPERAYSETAYPETAYPEAYTTPSYQPPEEFRTPVPEPPSPPPPAPPGPSATLAGLGTPAAAGPAAATPVPPAASAAPVTSAAPRTSATPGTSGTAGTPKAHAAPASPRRRITTQVIAALIALLIIAAVLWLVLGR